jgi:acyl-CoA reductase-like NAD-dependent aldehyde dehydrogenase
VNLSKHELEKQALASLDEAQVAKLAQAVAERLMGKQYSSSPTPQFESGHGAVSAGQPKYAAFLNRTPFPVAHSNKSEPSSVCLNNLDECTEAAKRAQRAWIAMPMEKRKHIIGEMRALLRKNVESLARLAVDETGLGRYEDKISKNLLVINKTPGPEYLESYAFTGDDGLALIEYAPYGIIGSITPTTNPSETIINNGISMLSAGNAVIFNPHPSAKKVSVRTAEIMDQVIREHGGPSHLLTMVKEPTIETAQALMKHPGIRLLVVTGGPVVARAAMQSGKKAIVAGPGNPPVVVDETADLLQAAQGIVKGASLDNNIVCIAEKEIIAVDSIADELVKQLEAHQAFKLNSYQLKQLEKVVIEFDDKGVPHTNKKFVGKNPSVILEQIGVKVGPEVRLVFAEVEESHPFVQAELLMPVLGLVRAKDVDSAIEMAKRVEHGFGHTATMYSKNIDNLHQMAREINTSIFVKNAPSYAGLGLGGEGFTSFTIASPTGEGLTTCRTFSRIRRCTLKDHFRIV